MPELLWTDALHDAPTLPPPRPHGASATSVEVPRPQRIALDGIVDTSMSAGRLSVAHTLTTLTQHSAAGAFDPRASAALPLVRRASVGRPNIFDSAAFDSAAFDSAAFDSAAFDSAAFDSAESTTQLNSTAESTTALYVGPTARVQLPSAVGTSAVGTSAPAAASVARASATTASPVERFCMLMTQALPLVRINDSERLERRASAERVAIVVVGAMAAVMTMLAIASALARLLA